MNCPRCGKKTSVTDSRNGKDIVIRVRKCKCDCKFKTTEYIDTSEETDRVYKDLKIEAMNKHLLKILEEKP